jgi:hypothetical protein
VVGRDRLWRSADHVNPACINEIELIGAIDCDRNVVTVIRDPLYGRFYGRWIGRGSRRRTSLGRTRMNRARGAGLSSLGCWRGRAGNGA